MLPVVEKSTTNIMGILNVTPDSFSDGGNFVDRKKALAHAQAMIKSGASLIDVGAESTAPGSQDVTEKEEWQRLHETLSDLQRNKIPFSVDTWKATIAEKAIAAGACMINDVTALRGDPHMWSVMQQSQIPFVAMYAKDDSARTTLQSAKYVDPIKTITTFFEELFESAAAHNIDPTRFVLDPGMGAFLSADPQVSFVVLQRLGEIKAAFLKNKILVCTSRKGFLRTIVDQKNPHERKTTSLVTTLWAARNGADFVRVHDVDETQQALQTEMCIRNA